MAQPDRASRLMEHARDVTAQIRKFTFSLVPEIRSEAAQKLSYGKLVVTSLDKLIADPGPMNTEMARDVLYQIIVSVRPTLLTAIEELQTQLDGESYFTVPLLKVERSGEEPFVQEFELDIAMIERQLLETDAEYRRAIQARDLRRAGEAEEEDSEEEEVNTET
jgi:hypothetical protein